MTTAVIATTPQGMIDAQSVTGGWVAKKLEGAKHELVLAEQTFNALQKAKLRTHAASAQINKARKRIAFYKKVQAALDAGYYIVPPFDVQLFAIRVKRGSGPPPDTGARYWRREEPMKALPAGGGEY